MCATPHFLCALGVQLLSASPSVTLLFCFYLKMPSGIEKNVGKFSQKTGMQGIIFPSCVSLDEINLKRCKYICLYKTEWKLYRTGLALKPNHRLGILRLKLWSREDNMVLRNCR